MKRKITILCLFTVIVVGVVVYSILHFSNDDVSNDKDAIINSTIQKTMDKGNIPGLSLCYIDGNDTYINSFGYSELDDQTKVDNSTLFQIGSNSKAFTAFAVSQLIKENKIELDGKVSDYLDNFYLNYYKNYRGKKYNGQVDVTVEQLLHHTSGIPTNSIVDIPESNDENSLHDTVYGFSNMSLKNYPGSRFEYATINYDILGLIIEKVTGESYEKYMQDNVFDKFGLTNTTAEQVSNKSSGYKESLFGIKKYDAPVYKGNTPAGYIVSDIEDMCRWIKIQMGMISTEDSELLQMTHEANHANSTGLNNAYYASGWYCNETVDGKLVFHGGDNPNFSSFILFNSEKKIGVCVLANVNSVYTTSLTEKIYNILEGNHRIVKAEDTVGILNNISRFIIGFFLIFIIAVIVLIIKQIIRISYLKKHKTENYIKTNYKNAVVLGVILTAFIVGMRFIPRLFFANAGWEFARVWMPDSLYIAANVVSVGLVCFFIYYVLSSYKVSDETYNLVPLVIVSAISGFGNSMIIFMINMAISRGERFDKVLFTYFIIGLLIYIFGQRIVRFDLIKISNEIIYKKRMDITSKVLESNYEQFSSLDSGQIETVLNNDTEVISNFSNVLITGLTSLITIICCFVYLGIVSIYGLGIVLGVVLIAVSLYMLIMKNANGHLEKARTSQNVFFKRIGDMIGGFKELSLNHDKKMSYKQDMKETCEDYKDKIKKGSYKFAGVFIVGESLFTIVIGAIVFIFPIVFKNQNMHLREYVFVLLYVTGPINAVLNAVPNVIRTKISWNRIGELIKKLDINCKDTDASSKNDRVHDFHSIKIVDGRYKYKVEDENGFEIGPINAEFGKGQISFIVGGNGSGKTTLVKLLTGLYKPVEGKIYINNKKVMLDELGKYYTTVFSDFYLFDKLYGVNIEGKEGAIEEYLKELGLFEKVSIKENEFSTVKLSTGQRKRLALLISYLEDKPIFLFDEWAADQDPVFREFFYTELLPKLKEKGKCIIAITHDDRYFNLADQVICMEFGKVKDQNYNLLEYY